MNRVREYNLLDLGKIVDPLARHGEYMRTYTGRKFYPLDPRPGDVWLEDIARHLAMLCRFNGGLNTFYSVAEHSVIVARIVAALDPTLALWALLHDAAEAYIGDQVRPFKHSPAGEAYRAVEHAIMDEAIIPYFGLEPAVEPALIKEIDARLCITEALNLRTNDAGDVMPVLGHLDLAELRGKDLACWCPLSSPCHADVLLELAK